MSKLLLKYDQSFVISICFLQNLLQLLAQRKRWKDALPYAKQLVTLLPDSAEAKAFLTQIERSASLSFE